MKSYNTVYNNSRDEVLAEKAALYESQKVAIVKALKENYMITKQISELTKEEQKDFAKKLFEYWSPKTGINKAGVRLLNENELSLSTESTKEDIRLYIEKTTKKHLQAITEAYRRNDIQSVTNAFKEDIEPKIQKTLKESFINNTIWGIVSNRIKMGID
ncbi:MAG: hypothetical protein [Wendovervirus sonii]|uniref:Uncharacterized protein n=1 Tax=phage Lak_Megaphage_Sonny TaxID=3109229 RepID=A0ABZ0Z2H2_9CAUD|nr:MAG: hypothetical protein [phage Lak_Megaphage_Sonny]